ncbi:transposase [Ochrobactrum sp. MR28]|uniref:IS66-like element accessory protein TnpA n=1 Tax=Paenochrobactrum gallinarii TaxID=643673 RepID=UPI0035BC5478|nr:transposase [Ochrobactrum sp. MR28]MBX8818649.1 transposase [Ochrobactrum sp. MR31]
MEPRIEFLTTDQSKRGKHRQWSTDLKARIVSESLRPGVSVQQVAERYGVRANYLSSWRTLARKGKLVLPAPEDETEFAAIVVEKQTIEPVTPTTSRVEIFSGSVIIRLEEGVSASRIAAVASALAAQS